MTLHHFFDIWRSETQKLFSRTSAKVGLVFAALLAVVGPFMMWVAVGAQISMNNSDVSAGIEQSGAMGLMWTLWVRNNTWIMRAFLLVLVALSFAGEYGARTIREDLVRPVPRWTVPVSKWLAVGVWSVVSLCVTFAFGGLLSVIVFGFDGDWGQLLLGYGASILADLGFTSLALFIAVASRSVAGTVAGVFAYVILDWVVGLALRLVSAISGVFPMELGSVLEKAITLQPFLPSSAFSVWEGFYESMDWEWRSFASLAVITVVCMVLSERVFDRLDVP
jgi:ABC-type transport system involved in multi-copper enzyme maturation permease subunit